MNKAMQMQEDRIKKVNEKKRKRQEEQAAASAAKVGSYLAHAQIRKSSTHYVYTHCVYTHCVYTHCVSSHCVSTHYDIMSLNCIGGQTFKCRRRHKRWSLDINKASFTMIVVASCFKIKTRRIRDNPIRRSLKQKDLVTNHLRGNFDREVLRIKNQYKAKLRCLMCISIQGFPLLKAVFDISQYIVIQD